MIADLWRDLRHAARLLARSPLFAFTAVLTLALAIGANTAIFSVVSRVLLQPLPYRDPERLISIPALSPAGEKTNFSIRELDAFRSRVHTLQAVAMVVTQSVNLTGGDRPERVRGAFVSANFFDMFRVSPRIGRGFAPGEDRPGGARLAVVSERLWRARAGESAALGSFSLTLNGEPYAVIGVVPDGFRQPYDPDVEVWMPVVNHPDAAYRVVYGLGYLQPGIGLEQARAEAATVARQLAAENPRDAAGRSASVELVHESMVARSRPLLLAMFAAVAAILLIACANLAGLLLARGLLRQREVALRAALGASRWRIVRQLLTETTLLAFAGGAVGVLLAHWGMTALLAIPQNVVPVDAALLDARVLLFTFALSLLTGWLFGLVPALQLSRPELQSSLRQGTTGSGDGASWSRLRGALVVAQVALSVLLLVGAALLLESFQRLLAVEVGFEPGGKLTLEYRLPRNKYPEPAAQWDFHRRVLEQVREVPGVRSAALVGALPFSGNGGAESVVRLDRERPAPGKEPEVLFNVATPGYFQTLGIPLLSGRLFDDGDRLDAPLVLIVNRAMAAELWPGEDALGKSVELVGDGARASVIGIVGDTRHYELDERPRPHAYVFFAQRPGLFGTLVVSTALEPLSLSEPVRQAVWRVDRDQPMWKLRTLESLVSGNLADRKLAATLIGTLGALALLLTMVGLYGVISGLVDQRTPEIGIRVALGAQMGDIVRMVLRPGALLVGLGIALGLAAARVTTHWLEPLLYQVSATEPWPFACVAAALAPVSLFACYLPARRAARLDPLLVLRRE